MNKISLKSITRTTEIQTVTFKGVAGLIAQNAVVTEDGCQPELKSTNFTYKGESVYYIQDQSILDAHIVDQGQHLSTGLRDSIYRRGQQKTFTIDELKSLDLNNLYMFKHDNIIRVATQENVSKWFYLSYDNHPSNYDSMCKHLVSLGHIVEPLDHDNRSGCISKAKVSIHTFDGSESNFLTNKFREDEPFNVWFDDNGISIFNGVAANGEIWRSWVCEIRGAYDGYVVDDE